MEIEEELYDQLYKSVVDKDTIKIRELLTKGINKKKHYGDEGNILNIAIDKAGPEQLKALLDVDGMSNKKTFSYIIYNLINDPCNNQDQTPLMKSAISGKIDCLKILLQHGADVNSTIKYCDKRAIDHALQEEHPLLPQIVLLLLKADSLFPIQKSGRLRLKELMNSDDKIKAFFNDRDSLHKKLKEMPFGKDIKNLLNEEKSSYYLNSEGESALWTTAWGEKFDTWAYLKYRNARDTGEDEAEDIAMALESQRESFNRALAKYYFEVRGTQVMKMVAKSRILGDDESSTVTGDEIEGYYKYLNGNEITSALLRIVHDEIDFEVIFDAHSSDVSRMIAIPGDKVRGLTEYNQNRVYISTKLSNDYDKEEMLGTLAHELAHKAIAVVFKNHGKPYNKDDEEQKKKYMEAFSLLRERVWYKERDEVDIILKRVSPAIYAEGALEQELIVRVPHMVAAYAENDKDTDGLTKLRSQFPELLNYYTDYVMPAFQRAISASWTNYKMTVKDMSDFHKCLKTKADENISVCSSVGDFRKKLYRHRGLGVLKVSNMCLGLSHLKAQLEDEIASEEKDMWREPLFLSWQQFKYQWPHVMKALSNRAVSTLVISWNTENPPIFCKKKNKCGIDCIFKKIVSDWVEEQKSIMDYDKIGENVIIVLDTEVPSIKDLQPLDYQWNDLSDKTKEFILSRDVLFQGKNMTVRDVARAAKTNCSIEDFMSETLSPLEISYLIDEKHISIGEQPGWSSEEMMYKNIFFHKDVYIERYFSHRLIRKEALEKLMETNDSFIVRNASEKDLVQLGFKEGMMSLWNPNDNGMKAKIYILPKQFLNKMDNEDMLHQSEKSNHPIHFLTLQYQDFVYHWSYGSVDNIIEYITTVPNAYHNSPRPHLQYGHPNFSLHNFKGISFKPPRFPILSSTTGPQPSHYTTAISEYQETDDKSSITNNKHLSEKEFILQEMNMKCEEPHFKSIAYKIKPTLIADNSGTGKSFVMNNMASALKEELPDTWIISTNLNFYASSHSGVWLDGLKHLDDNGKVIKFLFGMACTRRTTSLDLTLFRTFAKRSGGIIALFDGFDEICPKYKYEVISFLKKLNETSTIKFCVATRLSEGHDLQKALNCVAFKLIPFKIQNQKEFLNRYWNASLKYYPEDKKLMKIQDITNGLTQFGKINPAVDIGRIIKKIHDSAKTTKSDSNAKLTRHRINFEKFSEALIKSISHQNKDQEKFTETPLHIFMVANVVFEDNFAVTEKWNLSQLYERFLNIKMKIFDKEKAMSTDSVAAGRSAEMAKKSAYKILEKMSANIFIQPAPCVCSGEEIEDAVRVGLVKDVMGTDQFIHRSFAEFLFAKWTIRKAKKKMITIFWLQKLFFDSSFSGVWWFLENLLELKPNEKLNLKVSALSEDDLWRYINACLYVIIAVCFPSILRVFFNEFGVEVVKLLLKENTFPRQTAYTEIGIISYDWFTYPIKTLPSRGNFNAFQLIAYLRSCNGIAKFSTDVHVEEMTRKLLKLVVENDLTENLNQNFKRYTWNFFIPEELSTRAFNSFKNYFSEVINFLVQHQELLRDTLNHVFVHNTEIWRFLDSNTYIIMDNLASNVLQQHEYSELILKHDFVSCWSGILQRGYIDEIEKIWKQLSSKMQYEEKKSFLTVMEEYNQLHSALWNPRDDVWKYWWYLASAHIPSNECKKMIHSAVHPELSHFTNDAIHHCHQFLKRLSIDSYLEEEELVDLIIYEIDYTCKTPFAAYTHDFDLTARVFHLHQLLRMKVIPVTEYVCRKVASYPCLWFIVYSLVSDMYTEKDFSEHMMTLVNGYDEIINSLSNSPLIDMQERVCEKETKEQKFCLSLFFSILEMGNNYWDSNDFKKLMQLPSDHQLSSITELAPMMPNVLQLAQTVESPFLFGLFCATLKNFVPTPQIRALLFAKNENGDTAFHIASRSHRNLLQKLKKLAIDTIGEICLKELLLVKNVQGFLAEDLLHGADRSGGFTTSYDV